jgi:serine/threonine-protein kinase
VSEAFGASGRRPTQGRVGTVVNGKWQIDARIGSGGMATVYSATHRNGHRAALKMLHTQLSRDASTRARFLREGYVGNAVGHDGVVKVQDDGVTEDGCAFLVLDLLEGDTIEARRMRQGGSLPIDEALTIADQALDALAAAHERGIIHRDIKPDNVFFCKDGRVMLLDFGLARMKDLQHGAEATKTGVTIGTPEFMPPEQAQGRRDEVDARSDVWGLGATLFTIITGKYVHDASTLHEQLIASATIRPRSIRELAPHVPAPVAVVIDRALELEQAHRWESAREMQRAFRAARAPRSNSDKFVAESLTMPAASMRHSQPPPSAPTTAPSAMPVSSSGATLQIGKNPTSDRTIEDAAPRTPQMLIDSLPSIGPATPPPHTERITGTRTAGPALQASPNLSDAAYERTLASPAGAMRASLPVSPTLASSGSGPYAVISSGVPATPGLAPRGSGSLFPPRPSANPPPAVPASVPPASVAHRSSAGTVVIISVLLIVACAAAGGWALLHR